MTKKAPPLAPSTSVPTVSKSAIPESLSEEAKQGIHTPQEVIAEFVGAVGEKFPHLKEVHIKYEPTFIENVEGDVVDNKDVHVNNNVSAPSVDAKRGHVLDGVGDAVGKKVDRMLNGPKDK